MVDKQKAGFLDSCKLRHAKVRDSVVYLCTLVDRDNVRPNLCAWCVGRARVTAITCNMSTVGVFAMQDPTEQRFVSIKLARFGQAKLVAARPKGQGFGRTASLGDRWGRRTHEGGG